MGTRNSRDLNSQTTQQQGGYGRPDSSAPDAERRGLQRNKASAKRSIADTAPGTALQAVIADSQLMKEGKGSNGNSHSSRASPQEAGLVSDATTPSRSKENGRTGASNHSSFTFSSGSSESVKGTTTAIETWPTIAENLNQRTQFFNEFSIAEIETEYIVSIMTSERLLNYLVPNCCLSIGLIVIAVWYYMDSFLGPTEIVIGLLGLGWALTLFLSAHSEKMKRDFSAEQRARYAYFSTPLSLCIQGGWLSIIIEAGRANCRDRYDELRMEMLCTETIYPHAIFLMGFLILLRFEMRQALPPLIFLPQCIALGRLLDQGATLATYVLTIGFNVMTALVVVPLLRRVNTQDRDKFRENVMALHHRETALRVRAQLDETLRSLVPEHTFARLEANLPVLDVAACSTVSVCEIHDFVSWTSSMLPAVAVHAVNALICGMDIEAEKHRVVRLRVFGDKYVFGVGIGECTADATLAGSSSASQASATATSPSHRMSSLNSFGNSIGTRMRTCGAPRTAADASSVLQLASKFHRLAAIMNRQLRDTPLSLRIGCHSGPSFSGFIGARTITYDIFGPSIKGAEEIVRACPPKAVLLSGVTRQLVDPFQFVFQLAHSDFIMVPNNAYPGVRTPQAAHATGSLAPGTPNDSLPAFPPGGELDVTSADLQAHHRQAVFVLIKVATPQEVRRLQVQQQQQRVQIHSSGIRSVVSEDRSSPADLVSWSPRGGQAPRMTHSKNSHECRQEREVSPLDEADAQLRQEDSVLAYSQRSSVLPTSFDGSQPSGDLPGHTDSNLTAATAHEANEGDKGQACDEQWRFSVTEASPLPRTSERFESRNVFVALRARFVSEKVERSRLPDELLDCVADQTKGRVGHDYATCVVGLLEERREDRLLIRFANEALEAAYREFIIPIERDQAFYVNCAFTAFTFSTIVCRIVETYGTSSGRGELNNGFPRDWLGFTALCCSMVLMLLRTLFRHWVGSVHCTEIFSIVLIVSAWYAAAAVGKDSVTNRDFEYAYEYFTPFFAMSTLRFPWPLSFFLLLAGNIAPFLAASYLRNQNVFSSTYFIMWLVLFAGVSGAFAMERSIRALFRNTTSCASRLRAAEDELAIQRALLQMIVPPEVVGLVVEAAGRARPLQGGGFNDVQQRLGFFMDYLNDVVVVHVRLDGLTALVEQHLGAPADAVHAIERVFGEYEDTLAACRYLRRVQSLGDTLQIAGPLTTLVRADAVEDSPEMPGSCLSAALAEKALQVNPMYGEQEPLGSPEGRDEAANVAENSTGHDLSKTNFQLLDIPPNCDESLSNPLNIARRLSPSQSFAEHSHDNRDTRDISGADQSHVLQRDRAATSTGAPSFYDLAKQLSTDEHTSARVSPRAGPQRSRRHTDEVLLLAAVYECASLIGTSARFGCRRTAVAVVGSAFAAIIGGSTASFELIGEAVRRSMAIVHAAPAGFAGATESFVRTYMLLSQVLKSEGRLSLEVKMPPSRWSVRGAGSVPVYSLFTDRTLAPTKT